MEAVSPAGFFVLRTARLPFAAWTTDEAALRELLRDGELVAALRDASPSLMDAVERCGPAPWPRKVHRAVARYVARTSGRATPFGLLAAATLGHLADATTLQVHEGVRSNICTGVRSNICTPTPWRRAVGDFWHVAREDGGWTRVRRTLAVQAALEGEDLPSSFLDGLRETGLLRGASDDRAGRVWDGRRAGPGLTLGTKDADALADAAALLAAFTPDEPPAALADFAERFVARYGDAEVPLLEAVDPESGVGLRDVPPSFAWDGAAQRRLDLIADGADEIELTDDDVAALTVGRPVALPAAFTVCASLAADGSLWVRGVDVAGGARLLGRHAVGDPELTTALRGLATAEPHALEVRPGGPLGGAPTLWPTALQAAWCAHVGSDPSASVGSDPFVALGVSVEGGRVVLRAGGRVVVPRWSCALDLTTHPCDPLRLLGLLAAPGPSWLAWSWGGLATASRLPRIRRGRLVLAPGQRRATRKAVVRTWPTAGPHLLLDGSLPLRAPDPLLLPNDPEATVTLTEAPEPQGTYAHELLVPFRGPAPPPVARPRTRPSRRDARHDPGGPWLSVHLACGPAEADDLLLDVVAPWCGARPWFFLRYDDPEWHLRVRVQAPPDHLATLLDGSRRASVHAYLPEHHRYGRAPEPLHVADTTDVLALLRTRPSLDDRLRLAASGVAQLLHDAHHPDPRALAHTQRDALVAEQDLHPRPAAAFLDQQRRTPREERRDPPRSAFAARGALLRAADPPFSDLALASLAHLHVNRLLRSDHRRHEALVWDAVAARA